MRAGVLRDFLLGQPHEVLEVVLVVLEVSLAGHDSRLHKEDLLVLPVALVGGREFMYAVTYRHVTDEPGVHVDAGGLRKCPLSSLSRISKAHGPLRVMCAPLANSPCPPTASRGISTWHAPSPSPADTAFCSPR